MNLYKQIVRKLHLQAGDSREIFQGFSISFLMKIAGLGFAQLFSLAVARLLGAATWGAFSLALGVITMGSIIGTLGLDIGLLKLVAGGKKSTGMADLYGKSFLMICIASGACTILVFYNAHFIATGIFNKPSLTGYFKIAAFAILPFSLMKLNTQALRGLKKVSRYVFLNFVARHLFSLAFLLSFFGIFSWDHIVLFSYIFSLYLIIIISTFWLFRTGILSTFLKANRWFKRSGYRKLLNISLPLLLASSLIFLKGWIDSIMVGIFLSKADVGLYNIALKLSGITAIILTAVNTIAAPKFAEAYEHDDNERLSNIVQQSTQIIFYGTLPIFFVFLIFPGDILNIFGSEFTTAKTALMVLSIGNFVNALSGSVGYFMQMTDSQVAFQNITLATTSLGILLNYLLIPTLGINGAALSTCIGLIIWNLSCVLFIRYKYGIRTYYNPF